MRVLGISTTVMDPAHPRYSTSEALLESALGAAGAMGAEARCLRLSDLKFRACEGYYSKSAHACTWPCSITQMDPMDEMTEVYEGIVHWADVILVATPIRWGVGESLYYKMVERMNCVQNQVTIRNKVLLRNKVAAFIITGGQDNVQAVAGQIDGLLRRDRLPLPAVPLHRPLARLGRRGHGAQRRLRAAERVAPPGGARSSPAARSTRRRSCCRPRSRPRRSPAVAARGTSR